MCMADQYSTLSRVGSVNSTLRRSDTRDSSCQTEELKVVPPSVRRIRAQRGHGIAAQMASVSTSSSISTISDYNGIGYTQLNDSDPSFRSLPRQGSRISHQHCEPKYNSSPYRMNSGSISSLSYQFDMQHGSSSSLQMLSDSRNNTLNSPKLAENPNYQHSDQNNSPSLFSLSGALQNSMLYGHKRTEDNQIQSPHSLAQLLSSPDASLSAVSSCYESTASLCTGIHTETESQCSTLDGRNYSSPNCVRRDSNFSESSNQSCSTLTTDQWTYEVSPKDNVTSSCSSPVSHIYVSEEHSPSKTDTSSLFSVDNEGYYTSMRLDSGLKSHSHGCINKAGDARHSLYECKDHHSEGDHASLHSNRSLTRSISLRKAKKPPLPPARTDSLRRKPQRKPHHSGSVLSEQFISSLQQSLELNLKTHSSCSEQTPCGRFEDPWVLRPRSQSTISAASSGMSAPAAVCPVTPTHSDSSSQRSDYAESWDFYMDYPGPRPDQGLSPQITKSASAEENQGVIGNVSNNTGFPSSNFNSSGIQSKLASSPDKVHRLTSPSSGYSSQSNTPTAGTPVTSLIRAKSPAGRPKPKVPERKSSLRSSVSSSSTSLSSNTSDSIRNIPPPPPDMTNESYGSSSPASCSPTAPMIDPTPPLPPLPDVSSALEERHNSLSDSSTTPEECDFLDFPPPPPKVFESLSSNGGTNSPSPPPLPSPKPSLCTLSSLPPPPPPPPLLEMNLKTSAILKTESCLRPTKAVEIEKRLNNHTGGREKRQKPIITAQALQMVQLRPVKPKQIENIFTAVHFDNFDDQAHNHSETNSGKSPESETTEQTVTASCVGQSENAIEISEHEYSVNKFIQDFPEALTGSIPPGPDEHISNTGQNVPEYLSKTCAVLSTNQVLQCTTSSASSRSSQLQQKPPISPKKPNLSLIIPPIVHLPVSNVFELQQVHEAQSWQMNDTSPTKTVNLQAVPLDLEVEEESDSDSSTPVIKSRLSLSSELSSNSLQDLQLSDLILHEHDLSLSDKDFGLCDDKSTSDDGSSSSSGSISFKEDEHEENGKGFFYY